ncbi:Lin0512 family protein [Cognatishimia sp. F0-27]|uniref:Lin0512 family protein n=1 Tax=Cognatishimia sp. F0-27 TaxID=2816855 RepID=UPI001D0CB334|nr:Lin0512 family protein [Cognatishimia sp. F0-27]MCC1493173.1 Lin0512 family protein [Cognatishimia sp. F0-27]
MTLKRFATEFGMGVDLRGQDHTKAAIRAVKDALHRNSLTVAHALGKDPSEMVVRCTIGVAEPDAVDTAAVAAVFPYGDITVEAEKGGLDQGKPETGGVTSVAVAAVQVWLDIAD